MVLRWELILLNQKKLWTGSRQSGQHQTQRAAATPLCVAVPRHSQISVGKPFCLAWMYTETITAIRFRFSTTRFIYIYKDTPHNVTYKTKTEKIHSCMVKNSSLVLLINYALETSWSARFSSCAHLAIDPPLLFQQWQKEKWKGKIFNRLGKQVETYFVK